MATLKISDITIDDNRIRKSIEHIDELAASIREYGLLHPIVVEKETNRLIAGERRLRAHMVLELDTIEVTFMDELDDLRRKEIELEENLARQQLSWHEEVQARKELHDLKVQIYGKARPGVVGAHQEAAGWSLSDTAETIGLDGSTLSTDLSLAAAVEQFPELKNIPSKRKAMEVVKAAREKAILRELAARNVVIDDDLITTINGDCTEYIKTIPDASIDLAIVDPPFGLGDDILGIGPGSKVPNFANDPDSCLHLYGVLIPELYRVMKPGTHSYLFFAVQFYHLIRYMCEHIQYDKKLSKKRDAEIWDGFTVRRMPLIWVKEVSHKLDRDWKIPTKYEVAFFLTKEPARPLNRTTDDVFQYSRPGSNKRIHPMERPYKLMEEWIEVSSSPGDTVLDPFSGSFVVPHVCVDMDRKCIAIEKNSDNYERGMARLANAMKTKAERSVESVDAQIRQELEALN